MKYKSKVISSLDSITNQLVSLKNLIENNNISKEQLISELSKLSARTEDVSEIVSLESDDFSTLFYGVDGQVKK